MMDLERKYWSYVRFIKLILFMTGSWPCATKRSTNVIQRIICIFSFICNIAMIISIFFYCRFHRNDLEALMKGVGSFGTIVLIAIKLRAFISNRELISRLMSDLGVMSESQFEDSKLQPLLLGLLPKLSRYSYIQSVTVAYTVLSYVIAPLVIILYQKSSGIVPITYLYPFTTKFPWDRDGEGGILYVIHYLFNVIIGWTSFGGIIGSDALFCLLITQLCGQLRVLAFNFRNLNPGEDYDENFRECIRRYCLLTECRDLLQTFYGVAILTQFMSNSFVMCALIYQASQMKTVSVGKALTFVFYFASKFVQAFMYSWCGTLLTTESETVSYAAYDSDWTNLSDPKKMRNINMVISQRPLTLTACHFSVVSLNMFTTILNTTASYFCLLRTVEEK